MPEIRFRQFRFPEDYPAVRTLWENAGPGIQLRRSDAAEEIQKNSNATQTFSYLPNWMEN